MSIKLLVEEIKFIMMGDIKIYTGSTYVYKILIKIIKS